jgi:hypothetical protein
MTIDRRTFLLAIFACAAFFAPGGAAEPTRLRVLTYNIQHGDLRRVQADWKTRAPTI